MFAAPLMFEASAEGWAGCGVGFPQGKIAMRGTGEMSDLVLT